MTENILCEYGPNYYPKHKKAKEINNFKKNSIENRQHLKETTVNSSSISNLSYNWLIWRQEIIITRWRLEPPVKELFKEISSITLQSTNRRMLRYLIKELGSIYQ